MDFFYRVEDLLQVLRLVTFLAGNPTRQRVGGPRGVLDELAQLSKAFIEFSFSCHQILCCSPATIPVGPGPVVGIGRLPLQLHGLPVNVFQATARRVQKVLAIVELDEGSVQTFPAVIEFNSGSVQLVLAIGDFMLALSRFS